MHDDTYVIVVDENGQPYIMHSNFKKTKAYKYIQKIGDRYFYSIKELQAYYNNQKAKTLSNMSAKASLAAVKAEGRATAAGLNYIHTGKRGINEIKYTVNKRMSKALSYVARKLGIAAADAAKKAIITNAEIQKREVDRYIEEKYGDSKDIRKSILRFLNTYV